MVNAAARKRANNWGKNPRREGLTLDEHIFRTEKIIDGNSQFGGGINQQLTDAIGGSTRHMVRPDNGGSAEEP